MNTARHVPEKPSLDGLETKWEQAWESSGVYRFDRTATSDQVFAIDTPPPTVSGSLHVGHVFSYTHTDTVARYQRMSGKAVFYPMGWDDNGLPTERRVQNYFGVTCDPSLAYEPNYEPPAKPGDRAVPVSRPNFIELCERLTHEDEKVFEALFRRLGLSVDWSYLYTTIEDRARRVSQRAFLANLARGEAYQADAPTLWDVDFRTAVAQAELEDRERPGAYHQLAFHRADGPDVIIDTTRPELLPACVALVAHPEDARYRDSFGTTVTTPLFEVDVPLLAHPLADPAKGTGIAMVCTFGDLTDVIWWRELQLTTRAVVQRDGRLTEETPWITSAAGQAAYTELAGKGTRQAQTRIVELLKDSGELIGEPRPITHPVKFFEKGDRPLEIVASRQWYIRNGGRDSELAGNLIGRGQTMHWHPGYMRHRYEHWIEGLNGDWLISRQRYFGVPFPIWYPLDQDGEPVYDSPLIPDAASLPVDPSTDLPPGYDASHRNQPGGFTGDPDVMDTWATSSLTPQIGGHWGDDEDLFARLFPFDLRPQAHDIIRTWLFSTTVRSHFEHGSVPWSNCLVSGWILDPDRKKMSKSKGNVVTPMALFDQYGSDAVRYWAASARPGTDTAFDEGQMRIGRKLAIKLLNASKFVLGTLGDGDVPALAEAELTALDRALLIDLATLIDDATAAFDGYDYARALERTETYFWSFCDHFVELAKARAYGESNDGPALSARATLAATLDTLLRLFAPFLPFVAEEIWSWWRPGSLHATSWPDADALRTQAAGGDPAVLATAIAVLGEARKAKTEAKRSLKTAIEHIVVRGTEAQLAAVAAAWSDLANAGAILTLRTEPGDTLSVEVVLVPAEEPPAS